MRITQYDTTLIQERTAPEMRRRRCIRLRPRMGNIQRRERTGISPRKRGSCESKGRREEKSTKEAVLAGLRVEDDVLREARLGKLNNNIGCNKNITYIRGGARKDKMAKAYRRFTAGERATKSRVRTKHRGDTRQQEDHEVCRRDSPQELIDKAKLKGNTKIPKSNETLSSPHDQRRQWGGGRREGGILQGGRYTHTKHGWYSMRDVGIPTPGRRWKLGG